MSDEQKPMSGRILRVHTNYRGRPSKEQVIAVGDYAESDPALFGLAQYLIDNGHAEVVSVKPFVEPEPVDDEPEALTEAEVWEDDYESLTIPQLRVLADDLGVDLSGADRKSEIIERLRAPE